MGAYFFVADEKVVHSRAASNIIDLLQDFGGLFEILFVTFSIFGGRLNTKIIKAKFIRSMFYAPLSKARRRLVTGRGLDRIEADRLTFTFADKMNLVTRSLECGENKKFGKQKLLYDAEESVEKEMNMVTMLKTLHKVKACVAVLVGSDTETIQEINRLYLSSSTLGVRAGAANVAEAKGPGAGGYALTKFYDRDERAILSRNAGKKGASIKELPERRMSRGGGYQGPMGGGMGGMPAGRGGGGMEM